MLFRLTWSMPCSKFLSLVELYIWKTRISVLRWPSVTFFNIKLSIFTFLSLSPLRSLRHVGNLIMVYPGVRVRVRVIPKRTKTMIHLPQLLLHARVSLKLLVSTSEHANVQTLVLVATPSPQFAEHADQSLHCPYSGSKKFSFKSTYGTHEHMSAWSVVRLPKLSFVCN